MKSNINAKGSLAERLTMLIAATLLGACNSTTTGGDDGAGGAGSGGAASCELGDQSSPDGCGDSVLLASQADFEALLPPTWDTETWGGGADGITADLEAIASFVIDANQLAVPGNCVVDDCAQSVIFAGAPVPGTNISGDTLLEVEAGARFRIVPTIRTGLCAPSGCPDEPRLRIVPACIEPCPADERRCASDQVCRPEPTYCALCRDVSAEECACYTFCGPLADGSECTVGLDSDFYANGSCQQGLCEVPLR